MKSELIRRFSIVDSSTCGAILGLFIHGLYLKDYLSRIVIFTDYFYLRGLHFKDYLPQKVCCFARIGFAQKVPLFCEKIVRRENRLFCEDTYLREDTILFCGNTGEEISFVCAENQLFHVAIDLEKKL